MKEKTCVDCSFCKVKLMPKRTGRELAEHSFTVFDDTAVRRVYCEKGAWIKGGVIKDFSSMATFNVSSLKNTAESCYYFDGESEN